MTLKSCAFQTICEVQLNIRSPYMAFMRQIHGESMATPYEGYILSPVSEAMGFSVSVTGGNDGDNTIFAYILLPDVTLVLVGEIAFDLYQYCFSYVFTLHK